MSQPIRKAAVEIVLADEHAARRNPDEIGAPGLEQEHWCNS
jgi:predicted N-formylglutamate amidohydrolase